MSKKITGVFSPISTPFADQEVSLSYLKENVRRYAQTPLAGYLVLGSNGENRSLSEQEKLQVLETVIREKQAAQIVIAGVVSESTRLAILFAQQAAELGADYVSLLPPSYFKKQLTDEAYVQYYLEVAEKSAVPVMIYNAPGFNGVTLSPKVVEKIASHPNVAGMKDTDSGKIFNYLEICHDLDFAILSGTINTMMPALLLGAAGGVVSLANTFPRECFELYQAVQNGTLEEARQINLRLLRLNRAISGSSGIAGVKYAMELAGYHGGDPRRPLLPLTEAAKEHIRSAIAAAGITVEKQ
ncbi:MAG: dihydrodipicolinate synthase family protein [Chloroflexi bacterium]|nr:dihydrodipicolinate synthase family protein [Chloroflexota bacterium]